MMKLVAVLTLACLTFGATPFAVAAEEEKAEKKEEKQQETPWVQQILQELVLFSQAIGFSLESAHGQYQNLQANSLNIAA